MVFENIDEAKVWIQHLGREKIFCLPEKLLGLSTRPAPPRATSSTLAFLRDSHASGARRARAASSLECFVSYRCVQPSALRILGLPVLRLHVGA